MTPPKRILCGCDKPMKGCAEAKNTLIYMLISTVIAITLAFMLFGCTDSKASGPQHVLEIGDPVLVRSEFPTVAACEEFTNRLIVVLHKAKSPIPEPMRCS